MIELIAVLFLAALFLLAYAIVGTLLLAMVDFGKFVDMWDGATPRQRATIMLGWPAILIESILR